MTFQHKELTKDCQRYIKYLDEQSPIISTSHQLLRALYRKWGKDNVNTEIDRLFGHK